MECNNNNNNKRERERREKRTVACGRLDIIIAAYGIDV